MAVCTKLSETNAPQPAALAQDYAALGAVVDRFKLMTYGDHGGWGGGPGPIGALATSEGYVNYALRSVPAKKVYLGIPFFGFDWVNGANGVGLTWTQVQAKLALSATGRVLRSGDGTGLVYREINRLAKARAA